MPQALLEFHSPSAGMIATPVQPAARSITLLVTLLVFGLLLIAAFCPIDRVVSGEGMLNAVDPTIVVQPFDQAIVHAIDVREGDVVHAGQTLARLDPTMSEAEFENGGNQVRSLAAEVARLTAEATGAEYRPDLGDPASTEQEAAFLQRQAEYQARMDNDAQQVSSARADYAGFEASVIAYGQRLRVASDVQSMRQRLQAEALGSRLNSLAAADEVAEMQRAEAEAIESANGARFKIGAAALARDAYAKNWRAGVYAALTDARRKLYQARDDLARADLRHRLVVFRAPAAAVVLTVAKVSVGSVLQPGGEFITLMPLASPLEVEARIDASQSGYVRLGDKVTVKFKTFPFLTYGGAEGTVTSISADSFVADRNGSASSGRVDGSATDGRTYYRVRIALGSYTLHDTPPGFHLTPGMPVTADIKVGRRTMMQYLLSAVAPTLRDGMREP